MEYLFWNRVITKFQLVNTDATHRTRQFRGYVKTIGETYPMAGICTRSTAIRITTPMQDVTAAISLEPASAPIPAAGGPLTFDVKAGGSNAPWQAIPSVAWITVTAPVGVSVGDDTVNITVAVWATPGPQPRVGTVQIAALNLEYTVTQAIT
jgi:hypothetical protein